MSNSRWRRTIPTNTQRQHNAERNTQRNDIPTSDIDANSVYFCDLPSDFVMESGFRGELTLSCLQDDQFYLTHERLMTVLGLISEALLESIQDNAGLFRPRYKTLNEQIIAPLEQKRHGFPNVHFSRVKSELYKLVIFLEEQAPEATEAIKELTEAIQQADKTGYWQSIRNQPESPSRAWFR